MYQFSKHLINVCCHHVRLQMLIKCGPDIMHMLFGMYVVSLCLHSFRSFPDTICWHIHSVTRALVDCLYQLN